MQRATVGNVELLALSDMVGKYVVAEKYPDVADQMADFQGLFDDRGRMAMNFGCFLVRGDGKTVLVDTGFGPEMNGKLIDQLGEVGVKPEDVDTVVFTHLHGDHTGWALDRDTGAPRFSKAQYLVPKKDWDFYKAEDPQRAGFTRNILPIEGNAAFDLVDGERTVTPSLTILPTPGHTPGHQSLLLSSGGQQAFIIGDAFMSPMDLVHPEWVSTWDWDADIVRGTRAALGDRIAQSQALVASAHLPNPGLGHILVTDGKRSWQALPE